MSDHQNTSNLGVNRSLSHATTSVSFYIPVTKVRRAHLPKPIAGVRLIFFFFFSIGPDSLQYVHE